MKLKPLSVADNSVGSRTATAGNVGGALLLWPWWLAACIRDPTLIFVTERDLTIQRVTHIIFSSPVEKNSFLFNSIY